MATALSGGIAGLWGDWRPALVEPVVTRGRMPPGAEGPGLRVAGLDVVSRDGAALLEDVAFDVAPGEVIGLVGEAAAGKSLLLRTLADPFGLDVARVRGAVEVDGADVWERRIEARPLALQFLGPRAADLPGSALHALSAGDPRRHGERARKVLQSLVHSADAVDRIAEAPDVDVLSQTDARALAFARSFLVSAACTLFDRPEDGTPAALLSAVAAQIERERRVGRSFVLATEAPTLLALCDRILTLRNGRVVDFAPREEVAGRLSAGWTRFVTARRLEGEGALVAWTASLFRRAGDAGNQARLGRIAAELLAFSCHGGQGREEDRISFDFKHFQGHCLLRLTDDGALLTSGQMQIAQRDARERRDDPRRAPLAKILGDVMQFEQAMEDGRRVVTLKVATYDPRLTGAAPQAEGR
ncbi:MAG: ATP-binding cassette domain-containing protein [Shimia sp.]